MSGEPGAEGVEAAEIPVDRMRELVAAGEAVPLLVEFSIGPTEYSGRWWHVPSEAPDGAGFVRLPADRTAEFEGYRARLDGAEMRLGR